MKQILPILFIFLIFNDVLFAQGGIEGIVKNENNEILPFTAVYVKNTSIGTTCNGDGFYKIKLPPGEYYIVYNHLGYTTTEKVITVTENFSKQNIILKSQVYSIKAFEVSGKDEDPAYRVMRNAIAKAKFHEMVIKSFETKVYVKGTVDLRKVPRLAKSFLKKEGIDPDKTYTSESISIVNYTRPNKIEEKILFYNTTIKDAERPTSFIIGNFYKNEIAGVPSPLSQKAFAYYKYVLEGVYYENGKEINKIKVIPKRKGNVFGGYIYIVENSWAINNLDLRGLIDGANVSIVQNYAEIEKDIWLPLTQNLMIEQKLYGFDFGFNYITATENFKVVLDEELIGNMEKLMEENKIDENIVKTELESNKKEDLQKMQKIAEENEKITNKELKQLIKDYEKEKNKERDNPKVVSIRNYTIDSLGLNRDSAFWENYRPIPLSEKEMQTYKTIENEELKTKKDSSKKSKFNLLTPITGSNVKINENFGIKWHPIFAESCFNTVEGLALASKLDFYNSNKDNKINWKISPVLRYGFASEKFYYQLKNEINFKEIKNLKLGLNGGRYVEQFNNNHPINFFENTFSTLLFENNFIKFYEQYFVNLSSEIELIDGLKTGGNFSWNKRKTLSNESNFVLIDYENKKYTSNETSNNERFNTNFSNHSTLLYGLNVEYKPKVKYYIRNERKRELKNSSPVFQLSWNSGSGLDYERIIFHHFSSSVKWIKKVGIIGDLNVLAKAGTFNRNAELTFVEFKHFMGNRTFLRNDANYIEQFRMMDYYRFSTSKQYFELHLIQEFRQLLLTQFAALQLLNIRENLQCHTLITPNAEYFELVYGINNIVGFINLEAGISLSQRQFFETGFRIGLFANFGK